MLKPNQVPYEVKLRLRAVLQDGECDEAVAIAAAINAWPGRWTDTLDEAAGVRRTLILPLPMENTNDQA